jgi:hypothetical protein
VPWNSVEVANDDQTAWVSYQGGSPGCTALSHVDASFTSNALILTVFEGDLPPPEGVENPGCPAIAIGKVVEVRLKEPLEGREILDGAKARPE